jgi:predicted PurR-regulated permease PerM
VGGHREGAGGALIAGVAALYLARAVLVPIALARLLTFMVHPIVSYLTRIGLGRAASVSVVVTMLFATLGGICWILVIEFASLSTEIPGYRDNLIHKINEVRRLGRGGALERAQTAVTDVTNELQKETGTARPRQKPPTPVIVKSEPTGLWQLPTLLESLGGAAAVLALVVFMLIEREDLRNRIIRLAGYGRLIATTRALDEAGQRISRYLLMQSLVNASLGAGIAVGLLLLGVPYALLWGFLAAVLRFIPYVGVWMGAVLLVTFALAAFPTWLTPLLVAGLFVALELACSFALEPFLYGQSAGVSQVALLCSVTFWAWLWGPIGLLLATPLTVCLVVLAKHVPGLEFVAILMADEPPISPAAAFYQRLLAEDEAEAARVVAAHAEHHPLEEVFDEVIVPALRHARRDHLQETLPDEAQHYIWRTTREIVDRLAARDRAAPGGGPAGAQRPGPRGPGARRGRSPRPRDAQAPREPGPLDDRPVLAPPPRVRAHRARGGDASRGGLRRRAALGTPRQPHPLSLQAPAGALPGSPDRRGPLGPAGERDQRPSPARGGRGGLRRSDPGRDPRAPAARARARAAHAPPPRRAGAGDQGLGRPRSSSSMPASTGFVTCWSKPAASARRRSSAWP